ncbi:MAG TPA: AAA domain-containing protein [Tepidisphaeraceae bacterium]|jgi:hypothetical protein
MSNKTNGVLAKMLDRLFAAMVNGPSLNCRPHASRQRIDLSQLARLKDAVPDETLRKLLGPYRQARAAAKVPPPKRRRNGADAAKGANGATGEWAVELSPEEKAAITAWDDQETVFRKLRVIVEDARTYEQDTGVHVLSLGFPLLSLPPNTFKSSARSLTRRIVAPIAFIPVTVTVKQGAGRSVEIKCRGDGADLVTPNTALFAWLQQQTGKDLTESFPDETGETPWTEIRELVALVAKAAGVPMPTFLEPAKQTPKEPSDEKAEEPVDAEPEHLTLLAAPRGDDESEGCILPAAVLGLYPMSNQGLLRDTQEMASGELPGGPIASFLRHDALLEAPPPPAAPGEQPAPAPKRTRTFAQERLIAAADPSQSRAVRLARECQGLVIHGPPGTGKSQTITNIIGDHLSRGQRVLVVCDKRTALDVVIDRLDRLGLRKLCALVYDPQRDRRELYKTIRQQLDDLPDLKTDARAEREVDRLDAELQALHDELRKYTSALSDKDDRTGLSFHDAVGQWLAASAAELPEIDEELLATVTLELLQSHERELKDILDRAIECAYPHNPWRDAWGIALPDYLARPMDDVREVMTECVGAAQEADSTAHESIPPFAPALPLKDQAKARSTLAKELRKLLAQVDPRVLNAFADLLPSRGTPGEGRVRVGRASTKSDEATSRGKPSPQPAREQSPVPLASPGVPGEGELAASVLHEAARKVAEAEHLFASAQASPLDAELSATANPNLPSAAEAAESLGVVRQYADAYRAAASRYRFVASAAPSARPATILHWLSRDPQAVARAKQRLVDLQPIAQAISSGRMDRSLWLQFQRQPFDLTQTVRWLGLLNAYLDNAAKWYAFLKPGPKREAAPIAQFFGLALTPATAAQLRDFLTALRARMELKADLEDGILPHALPLFPTDEELLATFTEHQAVVNTVSSGQVLETGEPVAPERITPLVPKEASAAAPIVGGHGLPLDQASADRLVAFLTGLHERLRCVELLRELSIPIETALPEDAVLGKAVADASAALKFVSDAIANPSLNCLLGRIAAVMRDASAAAALLDGLDRSRARASGIEKLAASLLGTTLFRPAWLNAIDLRLRKGSQEAEAVQALNDQLDTLEAVLRVARGSEALPEALRGAADALVAQSARAEESLNLLRRSALATEITARLKADPTLHEIDRQRMKTSFERYRTLDAKKREAVRDATLHQWVTRQKDRLLAATGSRLNAAGAELRRRLTIQGEHAMRLRQVIALGSRVEGGDSLFDLCPVWMASPETVAQLFPRQPIFDVVIFDEASQCRLEEGLPALTRAKRVVIAGDPQQLPPTRFFESAVAESADEEIESDQQLFETRQGEIEDLLAAALNLEIQQSYLDVHYRSRNSDLIQFSNEHFYGSRLQPIPAHPSNRAPFAPITLYRADGTYEKRTNEREAEQVCQIVADLLKRSDPPSIGIACFNLPQRDLIGEKLDEMALDDVTFAKRLAAARAREGSGAPEALFVKNLENVQGDERDHIIISTTYGPDPAGRFYRRFGPVGRPGGGRRLNVLVTRARQEVHLVTSIPATAYRTLPPVPAGEAPSGAWLLFAYLAYAEQLAEAYEAARAEAPQAEATEVAPKVVVRPTRNPSAFAQAFAQQLADRRKLGSDVHWGNDGFGVDLALHHPSRPDDYTVGVLCDGSRFAQAEDPVEWDVFRTGVLEDQGWTLHRVWTPHFFRDPEGNARAVAREVQNFVASEAPRDGLKVLP